MKVVSLLLLMMVVMMTMMINSRSHDGTSRADRTRRQTHSRSSERIGEGSFNFKLTSVRRRRRDARARTFLKMLPLADFLLLMGVFFPLLGVSVAYICRFACCCVQTRLLEVLLNARTREWCAAALQRSVLRSCRPTAFAEWSLDLPSGKISSLPKISSQVESSEWTIAIVFVSSLPQKCSPKSKTKLHPTLSLWGARSVSFRSLHR